jgi:hypothetical protein
MVKRARRVRKREGRARGQIRAPPATRSDTAGIRRDTAGNRRDVVGNRPDIAGNRRDVVGNRRDTAGNRRDTAGNRRDAAGNLQRRHSTIGYRSPVEFELMYCAKSKAA